jgi:hypothetical protein
MPIDAYAVRHTRSTSWVVWTEEGGFRESNAAICQEIARTIAVSKRLIEEASTLGLNCHRLVSEA